MPLKITVSPERRLEIRAVREPGLRKLAGGDLILTAHVEPEGCFARRRGFRSSDGGRTWHADPPRCRHERAFGAAAGGTVLAFDAHTFEIRQGVFRAPYFLSRDAGNVFEGPLSATILIDGVCAEDYPVNPAELPEADHPAHARFRTLPETYKFLLDSADCYTGFVFGRYLLHRGGRWLAAMQGSFHGDPAPRSILVESRDGGATWLLARTIGYRPRYDHAGLREPALAETADGHLICVMGRGAGAPMALSRSTDGGRVWSRPELLVAHGTDAALESMSGGVLACAYGRPGRRLAFSEDGRGYGWGYHTDIGDGATSGIMGIAEIEPGKLLVVYDRLDPQVSGGGFLCAVTVTVTRYDF